MTKTKLQIMREKKGLTLDDLAIKIAEDNNFDFMMIRLHLTSYEMGLSSIGDKNIKFISQALGCSVDELVEEE